MTQSTKLDRMSKSLTTIRFIAGWTQGDLGTKMGLSRVSIISLQKRMSLVQYYAIRYLLMEQIEREHDELLRKVIYVLIDSDEVSDFKRSVINWRIEEARFVVNRRGGMHSVQEKARQYILELFNMFGVA